MSIKDVFTHSFKNYINITKKPHNTAQEALSTALTSTLLLTQIGYRHAFAGAGVAGPKICVCVCVCVCGVCVSCGICVRYTFDLPLNLKSEEAIDTISAAINGFFILEIDDALLPFLMPSNYSIC